MKIKIHPGLDHITDRADLLQDFVVFVCKDLQCMPCPIDIVNGREDSGLKTTAQYDPNSPHVMVNAKNRHFGDVLRSVAHELVHHKQNVKGELHGPVQDVGGDIEDEANARAGALLKSFAYQEGPERIYESPQEKLSAFVKLLCEQKSKKATGDGDCEVPHFIWQLGLSTPLPGFPIPTSGEGSYGARRAKGHSHEGIDFRTSAYGVVEKGKTEVVAPFNGEVVHKRYQPNGSGYYIVLKHCLLNKAGEHIGTFFTVYGHLHKMPSKPLGAAVDMGEVIGLAGVSGNATNKAGEETPQVHFETRVAKDPDDTWDQARPRNPATLKISDIVKGYKKVPLSWMAQDYKVAAKFLDKKGFNPQKAAADAKKKTKKKAPKKAPAKKAPVKAPAKDLEEENKKAVKKAVSDFLKGIKDSNAQIMARAAIKKFFKDAKAKNLSPEVKQAVYALLRNPVTLQQIVNGVLKLDAIIKMAGG